VHVHGLRKLLGATRIETRGSGYRILVEDGELDLALFEMLVERARDEQPQIAAATLRDALGLWRGTALADVDAPFAAAESSRLEEVRLVAIGSRIDAELACGIHTELVPELEALVEEHPYREGLRRQLVTALYRSGRQADALDACRAASRTLRDDLGIEPSAGLRKLERMILSQDPAIAAPARVDRRSSLPVPARRLVGRKLELAAVVGLLQRADVRLLTLTGPGGIGKTRLALEAAHELEAEYADGAFFVDLSSARDHRVVAPAIAEAVSSAGHELEPEDALVSRLAAQETLAVVDNFEHVAEAAPLIARLLAAAPALKVLATSRSPLRIAAENEYRVPPLDVPSGADLATLARNDAVSLFVERATAVDHEFALTNENAAHVSDLCRALDGLPLALELAAARVDVLPPAAIVDRLEGVLDVLRADLRDAPARQRTLRATIEWSQDLLDPEARKVFAALSVFAGGFTLDAAEQVAGADVDTLGDLVSQSLVRSLPTPDGDVRFTMLETIRELAVEQLRASGENDRVERAHCVRYLELAEESAPRLFFDDALLARLALEQGNVRAALEWARSRDLALYARLGIALWRFWYLRGLFREGRAHLEGVVERADALDDGALVADAYRATAILAVESHDFDMGVRHASRALDQYRENDDERGVLSVLTVLGNGARLAGRPGEARRHFEQSRAIAERLGLTEDVAVALSNLASVAADEDDDAGARELLHGAIAIYRERGRREALANALSTLTYVEWRLGESSAARAAAAEALELARGLGFRTIMFFCLVNLAAVERADGRARLAAELLGGADGIVAASEELDPLQDRTLYEETLELLRSELGELALEEALEDGRDAALDELVARLP
jgi:predicted ATPase/DNA-binding SARP family transcriptional activator